MRVVVRVDPTRCRGYGICALLFPDGIELDRWGYGRAIPDEATGRRAAGAARRAARACPNGAIAFSVEEDTVEVDRDDHHASRQRSDQGW